MADTKISALTAVAGFTGTLEIPVNDGGVSKKLTGAQIQSAMGGMTFVKKTADQTKTATTTLAADTDLQLALAAGTRYRIKLWAQFTTTAAGDFKFRHAYTGTTSLYQMTRTHVVGGGTALVLAMESAPSSADVAMTGTGTNGLVELDLIIQTTTSGTWSFQWAQNTSDAGNTIVRAGSYIEYTTF